MTPIKRHRDMFEVGGAARGVLGPGSENPLPSRSVPPTPPDTPLSPIGGRARARILTAPTAEGGAALKGLGAKCSGTGLGGGIMVGLARLLACAGWRSRSSLACDVARSNHRKSQSRFISHSS